MARSAAYCHNVPVRSCNRCNQTHSHSPSLLRPEPQTSLKRQYNHISLGSRNGDSVSYYRLCCPAVSKTLPSPSEFVRIPVSRILCPEPKPLVNLLCITCRILPIITFCATVCSMRRNCFCPNIPRSMVIALESGFPLLQFPILIVGSC